MMEVDTPTEPTNNFNRGGGGVTLTPEASRLFRVYKTVSSMLTKRGYMVSREMREMTPMSFTERFGEFPSREGLTILVEKPDDSTNQLFVFFPEDEKVGVKPIKILTDRMKDEQVSNAILVLRGDITPFAKQAVMEMSDSFRIEHFKEPELLVDITEHTLVPEHQVLSQNEKQELLKRYRLRETQLPRIQPNDPVARYYGMKRGQVVKIIRPSETAGRYVTYRVCL
ncbi:hypothetical protein ACHAWT_006400 [Skeletonema menzelii]|mmetsp:Transcript_15664/g.25749  ORF Transcript_15664/g.25749 Transcript_15664/m.25749 type:complete len:226 (-) Transcript_15664:37-714(-)